jgi:thiol-disulfide isomerase/thioredoxin
MLKKPLLAGGLVAGVLSLAAWGQAPATRRSPDAIVADMASTTDRLQQMLLGDPLESAESRQKASPQMMPLINHVLSLIDELQVSQPGGKAELDASKMQFYTLAAILDDPAQIAALKTIAAGTDLDATRAKAELAIADFDKADSDPERNKALDRFDTAVLAAPGDDPILNLLTSATLDSSGSASIYQHLLKIVKDGASAASADELNIFYASQLQQLQMVGKPLTVEGPTLSGQNFSSAQWAGKVILVDFWATWCPQCIAEMPKVRKLFADYHDKGLEVLGVNNDSSGEDVKKFLAQNPDMPWPQLYDQKGTGWNPIAVSYGIQRLPAMYLIDRKGILRTVEAEGQLEQLVPKLLAEK